MEPAPRRIHGNGVGAKQRLDQNSISAKSPNGSTYIRKLGLKLGPDGLTSRSSLEHNERCKFQGNGDEVRT